MWRPFFEFVQLSNMQKDEHLQIVEGLLEILPKGFGFLRKVENGFQPDKKDPHVPAHMIRKYGLKEGSTVRGFLQGSKGQRRSPLVGELDSVDGRNPDEYKDLPEFARLTSVSPFERLQIDALGDPTLRIVDLIAPIGKGQRALIVAPPRTGKTMLLQKLAQTIETVHPEVHLMVALIDERPEEVTEIQRSVKSEVIHSSADMTAKRHIKVTEMTLQRARRMVEAGQDVVILLDSITRMSRAYNSESRGSGRTLSGGLGATVLAKPREFFGAARKVEEGGSLTIIATALVDTGSRMDDVIFEEFKGTGNMELVLSRQLADRRIWPAIEIQKSGTRREELLRTQAEMNGVNLLRRALSDFQAERAMQALIRQVEKTKDNKTFLEALKAS